MGDEWVAGLVWVHEGCFWCGRAKGGKGGVVVKIEYILGITTDKNRRRNETK